MINIDCAINLELVLLTSFFEFLGHTLLTFFNILNPAIIFEQVSQICGTFIASPLLWANIANLSWYSFYLVLKMSFSTQ